jgi:hypothetical protein
MKRLTRDDYVLAVLATAKGQSLSPVQVQKLFFLLDARVSEQIGGAYFAFEPYDYGPFDAGVYQDIDALVRRGFATVDRSSYVRRYQLTPEGQDRGAALLSELPAPVQNFAQRCCDFVRAHGFAELVSAIYREFPDMKVNSVFRH